MDLRNKYGALSLGGQLYKFYMKGEDTDGAYAFFEVSVPPFDLGPPPHIHNNEDVAFYIVQGRFTFSLDENEFNAEPGDFVFLPRGRKHWLRNESDTIGRMLVFSSPAGFEKFYDATGIPVEDDTKLPSPPSHEELMRLVEEAPNFGIKMFL
ncbi:MAG: cupin domain-containing protein [Thermodesulfobacteriota bacterium]